MSNRYNLYLRNKTTVESTFGIGSLLYSEPFEI